MNTTTDAARKTYAALRNAALANSKSTKADFDYLAKSRASELADGEQVEPSDWVQAAREIVWELTGRDDLCWIA